MLPEKWLLDVGEQVVRDYIEDEQNSQLSGNNTHLPLCWCFVLVLGDGFVVTESVGCL